MRKIAILSALALVGFFVSISAAHAAWSTLGTGYAITSNYHGVEVPFGTPVVVTAGTIDTKVTQVTFRWHRPDDTVAREATVPVFTNGSTYTSGSGVQVMIRYAIDIYVPAAVGDWGVQAFFQGEGGRDVCTIEDVIKIKATSFNVVPEVPFGTAMILVSMLGAVGILAIRRKHSVVSSRIS